MIRQMSLQSVSDLLSFNGGWPNPSPNFFTEVAWSGNIFSAAQTQLNDHGSIIGIL